MCFEGQMIKPGPRHTRKRLSRCRTLFRQRALTAYRCASLMWKVAVILMFTPRPYNSSPCQDYGETDVDCGGPICAPCAAGRMCLYSSDCDESGSSVSGTVYPPGTNMVVCSASTNLCTDLRAGSQAYPNAIASPATVAFYVFLVGLPPALFSTTALGSVRAAITFFLKTKQFAPFLHFCQSFLEECCRNL